MTASSWDSTLEAFAARLDAQRAALDAGEPDTVAAFVPPPSIGPLPPTLRDRAEALLHEALVLETAMEASLAATNRDAQVVQRFAHVAPPSPAYIDNSL